MTTTISSIAAKVNECQLNEEIRRRDQKIDELESVVLQLKMQQLKNDHEEDRKLFTLENSLHNINNKLTEMEMINGDLRNHLTLSQNIIEKKNDEIKKLELALKDQQAVIARETLIFQHKLDVLQQRIHQGAEARTNFSMKRQSVKLEQNQTLPRNNFHHEEESLDSKS